MPTQAEIMSEFAERLGTGDIQPDGNGLYILVVDGNLPVFMQGLGDEGLIIFAGLGSIAEETAGAVCRALLESNHFWTGAGGFNLSLIPGTLDVALTARAEFAQYSGERLFDLFDLFVSAATVWRRRLPTLAEQSPGSEVARLVAQNAQGPGVAERRDDSRLLGDIIRA